MAKVPSSLAKALGSNHANVLSLVHSAFDISQELYNFSLWFSQDQFITSPKVGSADVVVDQPALQVMSPLAFENFNGGNMCKGFGIKTMGPISKGTSILKIKT